MYLCSLCIIYIYIHVYVYIYIYICSIIMGCINMFSIGSPFGLVTSVKRKQTCGKTEIHSRRIIFVLNLHVGLYGSTWYKSGIIVNMGGSTIKLHGCVPGFQSLCLKHTSMAIMNSQKSKQNLNTWQTLRISLDIWTGDKEQLQPTRGICKCMVNKTMNGTKP